MSTPALLVMDVQEGMVGRIPDADYPTRLARAVHAARAAQIPVMYVVVGLRPGHPEAQSSPVFSALPPGAFTAEDPNAAVHTTVAPEPGDLVVAKKRVSAFAGNDLHLLLRSARIDHLVLTGIATSGVVLSTFCEAADLDYRLTVLADGCCDPDEETHRVLTGKVFSRHAQVTTIDDWVASLG